MEVYSDDVFSLGSLTCSNSQIGYILIFETLILGLKNSLFFTGESILQDLPFDFYWN